MKTSVTSLSIWFAQVLMLCALHEDLPATQELQVSTTISQDLATSQTATGSMSTAPFSDPTTHLSMQELGSFTGMVEDVRRNRTIITPHHKITRLINETEASKNTTSVEVEFQKTGTVTESINIQETTQILTPVTYIQLDHELQTTAYTSQEISTPGTSIQLNYELQTTTMSQEISTPVIYIQLDHELHTKSSTSQEISTPGTSILLDYGLQTTTSLSQEISTPGTSTKLDHDLQKETSTSQEISTQGTSIQLDNDLHTETSTSPETSTPYVQMDYETKHFQNQTEDRTFDVDDANITTDVPLFNSTHQTDVTITSRRSGTTIPQSPSPTTTAGTHLEIYSTNQTPPEDTTNTVTPTGHTSRPSTITSASVPPTLLTSNSTEKTEEPLASSSRMMENTKALGTTQEHIKGTTNTTWRVEAWFNETEGINTTKPENISTSETVTPHWTTCFTRDFPQHPHPQRFSKRVCFITMWALGMVTSMFLGLSVFLWVRLSVKKKRARLGGGWRERQGQRVAVKEKESLWAEPDSSTEDRVEFWYSNKTTTDGDKRRYGAGHVRTRKNGEREASTEEEMWIQPKVTLKDITDFWHGNGRRHVSAAEASRPITRLTLCPSPHVNLLNLYPDIQMKNIRRHRMRH
ncbi:hypothetical protein C0J50_21732 [Silurus asotus]|uniref:Uncharacterized protein n=1 Tax=Silurus asotus TaxID=30991 RepID=A0AAD5FJ63_SILAS|nr:hypothetical protein C0J50_21732 [Silurus asotus]